jgi:hypothetical protein
MPTYLHIVGAYRYVYMYTYSLDLSIVYGFKWFIISLYKYVIQNFINSKNLGSMLLHTTSDNGLTR